MLPAERHTRIVDAVRVAAVVSTEHLVELLGVSAETVRRDLVTLERAGALTRVHGGAATQAAVVVTEEREFSERAAENRKAKESIGRAAAQLVSPGQTVLFDVGTTALEVARALPSSFRGTVATCSMLVAAELAGRPGVEVLVSGGRVRRGDLALSNQQTVQFFADLHADVAFLGSGGLDVSAGLTDYHLDEVAVRRVLLSNSSRAFVLVDSSKVGRVAPHKVCPLADLTGVVTDRALPPTISRALQRHHVTVVTG